MRPERDQALAALCNKHLIGRIKVDISSLDYSNQGRQVDPAIVKSLQRQFTEIGCLRHELNHHVPVVVDNEALEIIHQANIRKEDLKASKFGGTLKQLRLLGTQKLRCIHGQHRLIAAQRILPEDDQWWIADIYLFAKEGL